MENMEMGTWLFITIILIGIAYFIGRVGYAIENDKEQSDYTKVNEAIDNAINVEDNKTKNLLIRTLTKIGCQSETDEQTGKLKFIYRGEHFSIDADNESRFITIWNTWWAHMSLDDPDICKLKEAINETNIIERSTLLYHIDKEKRLAVIHSKHNLLFIAEIPDIDRYLLLSLDNFIIAYDCLKEKFINLSKEQVTEDRIRIKGFKME